MIPMIKLCTAVFQVHWICGTFGIKFFNRFVASIFDKLVYCWFLSPFKFSLWNLDKHIHITAITWRNATVDTKMFLIDRIPTVVYWGFIQSCNLSLWTSLMVLTRNAVLQFLLFIYFLHAPILIDISYFDRSWLNFFKTR